MNRDTADNRTVGDAEPRILAPVEEASEADESGRTLPQPDGSEDPLDEIEEQLDRLSDVDPADSVAPLGEITDKLNREIDADQETS